MDVAVKGLQDVVDEQWWIAKHVFRRGVSQKVTEVLKCIDTFSNEALKGNNSVGSGRNVANVALAGTYMLQLRDGVIQASVLSIADGSPDM